jgi:hypothetical protein
MGSSFMIRIQQRSVEDIMDSPGHRDFKLIRHRGYLFDDFKGAIPFWV